MNRILLSLILILTPLCHLKGQILTPILASPARAGSSAIITYNAAGSSAGEGGATTNVTAAGMTWSVGDLLVVNCDGPNGTTLSITTPASLTWTSANASSIPSQDFQTNQFWSIVTSGQAGSAKSVVCQSSMAGYLIVNVVDFSSSTGWPANPVDQVGSGRNAATTSVNLTNVVSPGNNAQAVEVNVARWGDISVSGNTVSGVSSGYLQAANGSSAFSYTYYRITSSISAPVFACTLGTSTTVDGLLTSFKPN